jgi:hypothetical protein
MQSNSIANLKLRLAERQFCLYQPRWNRGLLGFRLPLAWMIRWNFLILASISGCASDKYQYGISRKDSLTRLPSTPNVIVVGGDHPNIDAMERTVQYPRKVFKKWFPSKDADEQLAREERQMKVVQSASDYLDDNGLMGVNIDVREYNPKVQWSRLKSNTRIAPLWKYTGGTLAYVGYCILPGRAFGFDHYNSFTNTLSINSLSPPSAVFQAGYVKKIYDQRYPGTYIAMNWLPIAPLIRDASVSSDVLSYARARQDWKLEKDLYPQLYGRLGGGFVSSVASVIPGGSVILPYYTKPLLTGAGSVAGAATGKAIADNREKLMSPQIKR